MDYHYYLLIMFIFSSSLHLIQTQPSPSLDNDDSIGYQCYPNFNEYYTQGFADNLNNLLGNVSLNTYPDGFWIGSTGPGPDEVYALALCLGDLISTPGSSCSSCIINGSREIAKSCPKTRTAIIWYDHCYFKYSGKKFFGQVETEHYKVLRNEDYASNETAHAAALVGLLSKLSINASDENNEYMYASGDMFEAVENVNIYATVQCSSDISRERCKKCLVDYGIPNIRIAAGRVNGRFLSGSCIIRFENHIFIE